MAQELVLLTPDEVLLQPEDYDLPDYVKGSYREFQNKQKQPVKITRRQMQYFGERGCPWEDIERFYNVNRLTLMRYYKADYEKGVGQTNIALRDKMVSLALNDTHKGQATMLIWLGKNRLGMSDSPSVVVNVGGQSERYQSITIQDANDIEVPNDT